MPLHDVHTICSLVRAVGRQDGKTAEDGEWGSVESLDGAVEGWHRRRCGDSVLVEGRPLTLGGG